MSTDARHLVEQIRVNAERVNATSRERATFISDLLVGAAATAETASDLGSGTRESRIALAEASRQAEATRRPLDAFGEAIEASRAQSGHIGDASNQLKDRLELISTASESIRQIAMQTKMLALNASIEAKRAGDAGAGFEVIAFEVRKLSQGVEDAIRHMGDAVSGVRQANDVIVDHASSLQSLMDQANASAEACGDHIENLTARVEGEVEQAADNVGKIDVLTAALSDLTNAMRQIESNTQQAIEGSQRNIEICQAIDSALS
ncbi:MAG: hypothetical protein HRU11_10710 [Parvularculaceae bacterium]|nr:hypothetical protein [Parvularculaceae bacterium]